MQLSSYFSNGVGLDAPAEEIAQRSEVGPFAFSSRNQPHRSLFSNRGDRQRDGFGRGGFGVVPKSVVGEVRDDHPFQPVGEPRERGQSLFEICCRSMGCQSGDGGEGGGRVDAVVVAGHQQFAFVRCEHAAIQRHLGVVQDGLFAPRVVPHVAMPIQMVGGQVGAQRDVEGWPGGLWRFVQPPRHRARQFHHQRVVLWCSDEGLTQVAPACGRDVRRHQRRVCHGGGGAFARCR